MNVTPRVAPRAMLETKLQRKPQEVQAQNAINKDCQYAATVARPGGGREDT